MEETNTYENVAMFRAGMFGVGRTNCKTVTITTGVKYAQYSDAIRVVYLEKGKRTARSFMLDYKPWLRLLPITSAVEPADPMRRNADGSAMSRMTSFDPRWMTEFEDANEDAPWIVAIGGGDRDGDHLERCKAMDHREVA